MASPDIGKILLWSGVAGGVWVLLLLIGLTFVGLWGLLRSTILESVAQPVPVASTTSEDADKAIGASDGLAFAPPVENTSTEIVPSAIGGGQNTRVLNSASDFAPRAPVAVTPGSMALPATFTTIESKSWLNYRWADGDAYVYQVSVDAEVAGKQLQTIGSNQLIVTARNQPIQSNTAEVVVGTGTGFVVNPNGILMTCAHVVEGATQIEVELGGKTYPAEVVSLNVSEDLALIRIAATNLSTLRFADSNAVQLGQEVRVVGFPLSDVLGKNVKVTRGTISGIGTDDGRRLFQVDASINPGNSGGPLVNEQGEVVGVASAKLTGSAVSQVGFCVPALTGVQLLQETHVPYLPTAPGPLRNGPELVAAVSPAVAFLKVKVGISGSTESVLQSSAHLTTFSKNDFGIPDSRYGSGAIRVTDLGEVREAPEGAQLPFLLGDLNAIPFVQLPRHRRSDWQVQQETVLMERSDPGGGLGSFRSALREIYGRPENVNVTPAIATWTFKIKEETPQRLQLDATYEFRTLERNELPKAALSVSGLYSFDKQRGICDQIELRGNYERNSSTVSARVPVKLKLSAMTRAESESAIANSKKLLEEAKERMKTQTNERATERDLAAAPLKPEASADPRLIVRSAELGWNVTSLKFSPNGKRLAVGKLDNTILILNALDGRVAQTNTDIVSGSYEQLSALAYSPNGRRLLAGASLGTIVCFDVDDNGLLSRPRQFKGHGGQVHTIQIASDGHTVASGSEDNRLLVWDLGTLKQTYSVDGFNTGVLATAFEPNGNRCWGVDRRGMIVHFEVATGRVLKRADGNRGFATSACFLPNLKTVYLSDGYSLKRYRLADGRESGELKGKDTNWFVVCSSDNKQAFSGLNSQCNVWDLEEGLWSDTLKIPGDVGYIQSIALSPNGRYLAAAPSLSGGSVYIFDLTRGPAVPPTE